MKFKYVCNTCGAENSVVTSGNFEWDYESQDWISGDFSGDKPFCIADGCYSEDIDKVTVEEVTDEVSLPYPVENMCMDCFWKWCQEQSMKVGSSLHINFVAEAECENCSNSRIIHQAVTGQWEKEE